LEAIKILKILSMAVVEEAEATSKVVLEEITKTHLLEEVAVVGTALAINDQAALSLAPFGLQAVADTVTTVDFLTRDPPEEVVVEAIPVSVVVAAAEAVVVVISRLVVEAVAVVISRLVAEAVAVVISRLVPVVEAVGITTHPLVGQDDKKQALWNFAH
jgi:hypothetical protein